MQKIILDYNLDLFNLAHCHKIIDWNIGLLHIQITWPLTPKWWTYDHWFQASLSIIQSVAILELDIYKKNFYLFFKHEITCLLYFAKFLDFFVEKWFYDNFWRNSEKKSHEIQTYFENFQIFTMYVYYNGKHHSVNSIFIFRI